MRIKEIHAVHASRRGAGGDAAKSREAYRGRAEAGGQAIARGGADQFKGGGDRGGSAFSGMDRGGSATRDFSNRGSSSRQSMSSGSRGGGSSGGAARGGSRGGGRR